MKKNVVIVGAGVNGLVAANYLKKHDFNVTVLEKKNYVGGACVKDSTIINGKKIDFLAQEMHREANTIGSKSSTIQLSKLSIEIKLLIDQIKEQVQNLQ